MVSKEVLLGDFVGDFVGDLAFGGRCFCSLLVGDFVGLLAPFLDLPWFTSTLSCGGGGAPFAVPAVSNLVAMFLTDPAGRIAKVGVDLALLSVCGGCELRAIGGGLRTGDCDTALGASDDGGCNRCGGLPRVCGVEVPALREKPKSSPVKSLRVADVRGGLSRPAASLALVAILGGGSFFRGRGGLPGSWLRHARRCRRIIFGVTRRGGCARRGGNRGV